MALLRYFYQVNKDGAPIQGSNIKLKKRPLVKGKGQRWVEFWPSGQSQPCCPDGPAPFVSSGVKWRYYIRICEATSMPIDGSLEKHQQKRTSYFWQEIVNNICC